MRDANYGGMGAAFRHSSGRSRGSRRRTGRLHEDFFTALVGDQDESGGGFPLVGQQAATDAQSVKTGWSALGFSPYGRPGFNSQ